MARAKKNQSIRRHPEGHPSRTTGRGAAPAISSGYFKGMKLKTPAGSETTRPTMGKTRAAAMDALQGLLDGASVCDLFAGSGAVGIDALSRGAKSCVFVEQDRAALRALDENIRECERRCHAQKLPVPVMSVFRGDAMRFLGTKEDPGDNDAISRKQYPFDLIWADPPYALADTALPEILQFAEHRLYPGGILMIESGNPLGRSMGTAKGHGRVSDSSTLEWKAEKKYGGTYITSWKKR